MPPHVVKGGGFTSAAAAASAEAGAGDVFSELLMSRFENVTSQSKKGIRACERISRLFEDVSVLCETFAESLARTVDEGMLNIDEALSTQQRRDGFSEFSRVLNAALFQLVDHSRNQLVLATSLRSMAVPFSERAANDKRKLRLLESEEALLKKQASALETNVLKAGQRCSKMLAPLIESAYEQTPEKKKEKLKSKALPRVVSYFDVVEESNIALYSLSAERASMLRTLQQIEYDRLQMYTRMMCTIANVLMRHSKNSETSAKSIEKAVESLDADRQLAAFARSRSSRHSSCPLWPARFSLALPFALEDLQRFLQHSEGVLGPLQTPLEMTMALQRKRSTMPVPHLFTSLFSAIRSPTGLVTEGIFRVTPSTIDLSEATALINRGLSLTIDELDPVVAASLLKKWLRELPNPLLHSSLHNECLVVGARDSASQDDAVDVNAIAARLSDPQRHILSGIVELVRELTQPEFAAKNKMSMEALAIVLSPALLRAPGSPSPAMLAANSQAESCFLVKVFKCLDTTEFVKEVLPVMMGKSPSLPRPPQPREVIEPAAVKQAPQPQAHHQRKPCRRMTRNNSNKAELMQAVAAEAVMLAARRNCS